MELLLIDANPKAKETLSFSHTAMNAFVARYRVLHPDHTITHLHTAQLPIPRFTTEMLRALESGTASMQTQAADALCRQFVNADRYVFVTPNWNLLAPAELIGYIHCIMRAGITFRYTEKGSVGLLHGKKALHILASGGSTALPGASCTDAWLRSALAMNGVADYQTVTIDRTEMITGAAFDALLKEAETLGAAAAETF